MPLEIKITKEYHNQKPKNFLKKKLDLPFFKVVNLIRDKRVKINGKKIKKDEILKEGDIITVWAKDVKLREVKKVQINKKNLGLNVILDEEDFVIFNKLPDIVVQGAQHKDTTISLHFAWYKDKIGDKSDFEYFHAHRLDKDTSGLLVVAKTPVAIRKLNKIFRERDVVKKYTCLCIGEFIEKEGIIELHMKKNPEGSREKMSFSKEEIEGSKMSISHYKVLEEYEDRENETYSLVEVEIKTGLTHQIRVHMKSLGHPIYGDKMYGNSIINKKHEDLLSRQFLHASYLKFNYENKNYEVNAELTEDLKFFLNKLSKLK